MRRVLFLGTMLMACAKPVPPVTVTPSASLASRAAVVQEETPPPTKPATDPYVDTDGDGIIDNYDACPKHAPQLETLFRSDEVTTFVFPADVSGVGCDDEAQARRQIWCGIYLCGWMISIPQDELLRMREMADEEYQRLLQHAEGRRRCLLASTSALCY